MKLTASAFLCLAFSASGVHADPVPVSIQKALKPFTIKSTDLSSGVLRVVMDRPMVSMDMYQAVSVSGICHTLFTDEKAGARINKVEVLNDIAAQGYALEGGGKTCAALGPLNDAQSKQYVAERTVTCVAGNCRKR